ncbi:hypothetical protein LZ318_37925 [Saccharopolyspora indica]|uniref:hypothetical protein n=1 Tax=Saccharopolyspora indica TaxID=1229659 RepID=UPI0022EB05DA|nr:hypothetical protein [Saccharopolyspora indica]MDA3642863.1 hypothetical protein [Saccharopolyspora indica]
MVGRCSSYDRARDLGTRRGFAIRGRHRSAGFGFCRSWHRIGGAGEESALHLGTVRFPSRGVLPGIRSARQIRVLAHLLPG